LPDGIQLDPFAVLGLAREATPQQVREAFRLKSKKYHPDHGGEEWAFRVIVWAYEALGEGRRPLPDAPTPARGAGPIFPQADLDAGQLRPGLHDRNIDPSRIVNVEIIWMRYEVEDVLELLTVSTQDRNLSGTIHINWPDPNAPPPELWPTEVATILRELKACVEAIRGRTKVQSAQVTAQDDRFEAWLSYPSGSVAWEAFRTLHVGLKMRGLGVRQWTRDLTVPRPGT
jgi:hypothetical protein